MDQSLVNRIVEAALMAASQPLTLAQLHGLFPEEEPAPAGSVERALEDLRDACVERGVELVEVASGFRYQVKAEVHGWVARLWTERKTRYSRATLETLALIAYRQPITRGEIEQVRGVAVSSNIIQALEEREWIRVVGHRDVPGKPALFGTTKAFLDYFGLKRLDELPPLSELKDIGELEPQLQLDDAPMPAGVAMDASAESSTPEDAEPGTAESEAEADAEPETEDELTVQDARPEHEAGAGARPQEATAQDAQPADAALEHEPAESPQDDAYGADPSFTSPQDDDAENLDEGQVSSEQKP